MALDPEYWLLRNDLPGSYEMVQALRTEASWGRYWWVPDALPFDVKLAIRRWRELFDFRRPLLASQTLVSLELDPTSRSLVGSAEVVLTTDSETLDPVRFYLSAAEVTSVVALNPGAVFSYEGNVLTLTPESVLNVVDEWVVQIEWYDEDIELSMDLFPEGFGQNVLVAHLGEPSTFFTFGYWFWPALVGQGIISDLEFSVTYPDDLTLVMSGSRIDSSSNGDGTATDVWRIDQPTQWHGTLALADYQMAAG